VLDEEEALPLLKHAYERGINTWDTARSLNSSIQESKALKLTWHSDSGRCLLQWPIRRNRWQSVADIRNTSLQRRDTDKVLLWR
jgi:hypothetical protein